MINYDSIKLQFNNWHASLNIKTSILLLQALWAPLHHQRLANPQSTNNWSATTIILEIKIMSLLSQDFCSPTTLRCVKRITRIKKNFMLHLMWVFTKFRYWAYIVYSFQKQKNKKVQPHIYYKFSLKLVTPIFNNQHFRQWIFILKKKENIYFLRKPVSE